MKVTGSPRSSSIASTDRKPFLKSPCSRSRNGHRVRRRPVGTLAGRRSRPETPLLKWKTDEGNEGAGVVEEEELDSGGVGRRRKGVETAGVSARKIGAGLWRLQVVPEMGNGARRRMDRLGFRKPCASHVGFLFIAHPGGKARDSGITDPLVSPTSVSSTKNRFLNKFEPSFQFSSAAMEGATKWNPVPFQTLDDACQIYSHSKRIDEQVSTVAVVSALESELEQARTWIKELETERRSSKKKLEHFLKKVSEERAAWRSREHEKVRVFIDDIKAELKSERKNRQRLEILNAKLVNELADAKVSAKRFMQNCEKERKTRVLVEEVCDELVKEIGEDKAEVEELKRESMKLQEELIEERRMLQMAEVWREERVQMKLIDAKVALEEKFCQMNKLVADVEAFLKSRNAISDSKEMRKAESLVQAASTITIQDMEEFNYEPPNSDDIFSMLEINSGEPNEREIEECTAYSPASHPSKVSPGVNKLIKDVHRRQANGFSDDIHEDDESGWETVSHLEDQGSSYSPTWSEPSVNRNYRNSNVSMTETLTSEVTEICSMPTKQLKKVSSIARLWRSGPNIGDEYKPIAVDGIKGRLSNARKSNGCMVSADQFSGKGGFSPQELEGQWSSPDSWTHDARGIKGFLEWPRGAQKNSLKAKLLEARMESQKIQLRQVLNQRS